MENALRVLVGYASRFGSTRDIATRIAATVRTHSADVDVRSPETIMSFDSYDAVVFGSGVYDSSWAGEATELLRQHAGASQGGPSGCSAWAPSEIDIPSLAH